MAESDIVFPIFTGEDWKDEPPGEWTFENRRDFERFYDILGRAYTAVLSRYQYNTIPSFVSFYKKFRESRLPKVQIFHEANYQVEFSTSCLSSIGLCILLKIELLRALMNGQFEKARRHLFIAGGIMTPNDRPSDVIQTGEAFWPAKYTDQVCLVMKFTFESRKGHFLMNFDYGLNQTFVAMEDGNEPHSIGFESASWTGRKSHIVRHLNDKYVLWTVEQPDEESEYRVFYLKRTFRRLDYPEKRLRVNPMQAAMTYTADRLPRAGYCTVTRSAFGHLSAFTLTQNEYMSATVISGQALHFGQVKDQVLNRCLMWLGGDAMEMFSQLVPLCSDKAYATQLLKLNESLTSRVDNLWNDTPES